MGNMTWVKQNRKWQYFLHIWWERIRYWLQCRFKEVVSDPDTKVVVLTGTDPYYCAGVNLSATIQPMHPKKLHDMIYTRCVRIIKICVCNRFVPPAIEQCLTNSWTAPSPLLSAPMVLQSVLVSPQPHCAMPSSPANKLLSLHPLQGWL